MGHFFHNPSFNEYASLLRQLHLLMSSGKSDSDEAESVRDEMELPWRNLDLNERRLLDGLSADLYSIGVDRAAPVEKPEVVDFQRYTDALQRKDWVTALDIVRRNENRMQAAEVAFVRGVCWAQLHQPRIALHFLDEAYRLGRRDVLQDVLAMNCNVEIGVTDETAGQTTLLAFDAQHPLVVLKSATALLGYALRSDDDLRARRIAESLTAFRRGLGLAGQGLADPTESTMLGVEVLNAHIQMAIAYDAVDQPQLARSSCLAALDIDPINEHALTLLGWLDQRSNDNARKVDRPDAFRVKQHRATVMHSGDILASFSPQPSLS